MEWLDHGISLWVRRVSSTLRPARSEGRAPATTEGYPSPSANAPTASREERLRHRPWPPPTDTSKCGTGGPSHVHEAMLGKVARRGEGRRQVPTAEAADACASSDYGSGMESTESRGPFRPRMPPMAVDDPVVRWLLQGDPAIRWQVLRDLLDASESVVAAERAGVEHEGWGARLLALRAPDGLWANGACFPGTAGFAADTARALAAGEPPPPWPSPDAGTAEAPTDESGAEPGQPWTATYRVLLDLCDLGAPPDSPVMQETAHLVARNCRWECDGLPFFAGEEDCCINAGTILIGTYLGVDVDAVVQRLLADQMPDGGWNCWAETRPAPSSFASTLDVVDALLRWERRTGGSAEVRRARWHGEEYLLRRGLFRSLRTGEVVDPQWGLFSHPPRWRYDLLKATEYFARREGTPDPRLAEAIERVRAKRRPDGRWLLENTHPGAVHFRFEEPDGTPSRWNTLRALRVLRWYDASAPSADAIQASWTTGGDITTRLLSRSEAPAGS